MIEQGRLWPEPPTGTLWYYGPLAQDREPRPDFALIMELGVRAWWYMEIGR